MKKLGHLKLIIERMTVCPYQSCYSHFIFRVFEFFLLLDQLLNKVIEKNVIFKIVHPLSQLFSIVELYICEGISRRE